MIKEFENFVHARLSLTNHPALKYLPQYIERGHWIERKYLETFNALDELLLDFVGEKLNKSEKELKNIFDKIRKGYRFSIDKKGKIKYFPNGDEEVRRYVSVKQILEDLERCCK